MIFVYTFYIHIGVLTWGVRFIEAAGNFKKEELEHLSKMLHPLECQHILAAINKLSDENGNSLRSRNHIRFHRDYPTRSNCLTGLKKWVHEISGKGSQKNRGEGRLELEDTLMSFGRPDLVRYLKNRHLRRSSKLFPRHFRRHAAKITQHNNHIVKEKKKHHGFLFKRNSSDSKTKSEDEEKKGETGNPFNETTETTTVKDIKVDKPNNRWAVFVIVIVVLLMILLCTVIFALRKNYKDLKNAEDDIIEEEECIKSKSKSSESSAEFCPICHGIRTEIDGAVADSKSRSKNPFAKGLMSKLSSKKDQRRKIQFKETTTTANNSVRLCMCSGTINENSSRCDVKRLREKIAIMLRENYKSCESCKSTFANEGKGKSGKLKFVSSDLSCDNRDCQVHKNASKLNPNKKGCLKEGGATGRIGKKFKKRIFKKRFGKSKTN